MSDALSVQLLELAASLVLVCSFVVLWRRDLAAIVRALVVQGVAIGAVAFLLGLREHDPEPIAVAVLVIGLKGLALPGALARIVGAGGEGRESQPLVNVPASLLAGAGLTLLAYATTRDVVALDPTPGIRAVPIGIAVALLGFFVLVTRRQAVSQIAGFLLVDNGIALVAFLATSGVPLIVELGVSLDVVLAVLILQVLTTRMRTKFGALDLDQLRELHD